MGKTNTELWHMVMQAARIGEADWKRAWREVRAAGGRDLVKEESDFEKFFERFAKHPLFAAQMYLSLRENDLTAAIKDAVYAIDPADDNEVRELSGALAELDKGSEMALLHLIDTVAVKSPITAEALTAQARALHPQLFKDLDDRSAADKQQSLPLEPELAQPVPAVPEGV